VDRGTIRASGNKEPSNGESGRFVKERFKEKSPATGLLVEGTDDHGEKESIKERKRWVAPSLLTQSVPRGSPTAMIRAKGRLLPSESGLSIK